MPFQRTLKQHTPFLLKRARYLFSRLIGIRLQKNKSLHFVTIDGHRFKRLIFGDSFIAAEIERNLECFRDSGLFSPLVTRYEREIWVEFIEGDRITTVNQAVIKKLADFYATVYTRQVKRVNAADSLFPQYLQSDLRFLNQVGIISDSHYGQLRTTAERLIPEHVWMGFDYTDPVLKNFLLPENTNSLLAIDVEALASNQLIGMGLIKACVRWVGPYRKDLFDHLAHSGVPDFQSYLPFIELCFLAKWTKRNFFEKKWKFIDPALFSPFYEL